MEKIIKLQTNLKSRIFVNNQKKLFDRSLRAKLIDMRLYYLPGLLSFRTKILKCFKIK